MRRAIIRSICFLALATAAPAAETSVEESAGVVVVVDKFYDAFRRGDKKALMELLPPDAVILESGSAETRSQYEQHHLAEDIAFARATKTERSHLTVRQEGNVAWTTATSKTTGTFNGRKIDSVGVELMVLTKGDTGWRIRAIHWSSHSNNR